MQRAFLVSLMVSMLGAAACSSDNPAAVPDGGPFDGAGGLTGAAANGGSSGNGSSGGAGTNGSLTGADGGILGVPGAGWSVPPDLELCGGACQCSDGLDNDGDGVADGFDTECVAASDNDEGSFATGISGDNVDPKWQDCFFDGNSGAGNDGCRYSTKCLTGELEQDHPDCVLSQNCIEFCKPLAPNGCDCFGCCDVRDGDGKVLHIVLSAGCNEDDLDACMKCEPSTQCVNKCGECELCPGKTLADLPASCQTDPPSGTAGTGGTAGTAGAGGAGGTGGGTPPPPYSCDDGEPVCRSNADCSVGFYCSFGCCLSLAPD